MLLRFGAQFFVVGNLFEIPGVSAMSGPTVLEPVHDVLSPDMSDPN